MLQTANEPLDVEITIGRIENDANPQINRFLTTLKFISLLNGA